MRKKNHTLFSVLFHTFRLYFTINTWEQIERKKKYLKTVNVGFSCECEASLLLCMYGEDLLFSNISVEHYIQSVLFFFSKKHIYHLLEKLFPLIRLWNCLVKLHEMYILRTEMCVFYLERLSSSFTCWEILKAI